MNTYYFYQGITLQGTKISGDIEAYDKTHATSLLHAQGIFILHLRKRVKLPNRHLTKPQQLRFFQQLTALLSANIAILHAMHILYTATSSHYLRHIIDTLRTQLEMGKSLSSILLAFTDDFDLLTCHLIHLGEQSGTLIKILECITNDLEKKIRFRKKIQHALLYPSMVTVIAISVTWMMLLIVIPRFVDLFHHAHQTLPIFTQCVISLSQFLQKNSLWLFFFIILLIYTCYLCIKNQKYRTRFDYLLLKIPWISNFIIKLVMIRFLRNSAILLSAGLPIAESLHIVGKTCGHSIFARAIAWIQKDIAEGARLHHALQKNPIFPILLIDMVKVGEESGQLDSMLEKIAQLYESEIDQCFERVSQLLEPLIMVILGVVIGSLVIAMYLPLFRQGTLI